MVYLSLQLLNFYKKIPTLAKFGDSECEDVLYKETTIKKVVFLYSILSRNEVKINVGRTT